MVRKIAKIVPVFALLILALAGCKNGMLHEDEATVNGAREVDKGTVSLLITNLVDGGPTKAIAPTQIDLANAADYTFVATGYSRRAQMTPKVVTVDPATKMVDYSMLDTGVWTLTLTAYDNVLLGQQRPPVDPAGDVNLIVAATGAAVLSGTATVDLMSSGTVGKITLTPWGIGTEGTVNLTVNFHTDDVQKIQAATANYEVTIGLYNKDTNLPVDDQTNATTVKQVAPFQAAYTYNVANKIAKGEYIFRVTIAPTQQGQQAGITKSAVYNDILVIEGNRETSGTVNLPKLLDEKPRNPENFAAYWDSTKVNTEGDGYVVQFAWDSSSFNETTFVLEIADITEKFAYNNPNIQYNGTTVAAGDALWTAIEGDPVPGSKLDKDNFTASTSFPIYAKVGGLAGGNKSVEYRMLPGRVYAARLAARNDYGQSDWVHLGVGADPASRWTPGPVNIDRLDSTNKFLFAVYTITYDLRGQYIMLKNNEQHTAGVKSAVKPVKYEPGVAHAIDYKIYANPAATDGYQLYPASFAGTATELHQDRVAGWNGWKNSLKPGSPTYDNTTGYDGFENAKLQPVGPGVTLTGPVGVISSGTVANLLTADTLMINTQALGTNGAEKLSGYVVDIATTSVGLGKVNTTPGVNMSFAGGTAAATTLYFNIGAEVDLGTGRAFSLGYLEDAEGRPHPIITATYELRNAQGDAVKSVTGAPGAQIEVTGMDSGYYTLFVHATPATGNPITFQTPFVIKYDDERL